MTRPEKYSELENAVRFALDADEELLWAERRSYTMDRDVWAVLAGGMVMLSLGVIFSLIASRPEPPDYCNIYTIALSFAAAVICLFCAVYAIKGNSRTVYALTQHRALIVMLPPIGKPVVYTVPLARDMVHRLFPRLDGSTDYYMMELPLGRYQGIRDYGFLRVRNNESLQAELARRGVELPTTGVSRRARYRLNIYDGLSPLLPMFGWFVLLVLMLATSYQQLTSHSTAAYFNLWLNGEKCTATVIGYNKKTTRRTATIDGKPRDTTVEIVYHPIYRFALADGTLTARTEAIGSRKAYPKPGEQVTVYYDPQHPWQAMRRNFDELALPLFFLGMGGVCIYLILNTYQRYRRTLPNAFYLIAPDKGEEY